jgi:hypothetical protein
LRLDGTQSGNFFFQVSNDRRTFCTQQMRSMPRTPVGAHKGWTQIRARRFLNGLGSTRSAEGSPPQSQRSLTRWQPSP